MNHSIFKFIRKVIFSWPKVFSLSLYVFSFPLFFAFESSKGPLCISPSCTFHYHQFRGLLWNLAFHFFREKYLLLFCHVLQIFLCRDVERRVLEVVWQCIFEMDWKRGVFEEGPKHEERQRENRTWSFYFSRLSHYWLY